MIADDPVHAAGRTFRSLLAALAHPGRVTAMDAAADAPAALGGTLAAAALALFDRDVAVWIAPDARDDIVAWLVAQTGCRLVTSLADAQFGVLLDVRDALPLERWHAGTPEDPEGSVTLLVRVDGLTGGAAVRLAGPGIEHAVAFAPRGVSAGFWREWAANCARFPVGIDCFLFEADSVAGLPRTVTEQAT